MKKEITITNDRFDFTSESGTYYYYCPNCESMIERGDNYCPNCGCEIKWRLTDEKNKNKKNQTSI